MSSTEIERLIVFVKAPRPGSVKTRLAESLGADGACAAYRRLVEILLGQLREIAKIELRFAPDDAEAEIRPWLAPSWTALGQGPGDLGERLTRAFDEAFAGSAGRVVIIGSDCPWVTAGDIRVAWDALSAHDVVLGPAADGGYWLIGLRGPQQELFRGIAWSTARVLEATSDRARAKGLSVARLRELHDVDTVEDWRRFRAGLGE